MPNSGKKKAARSRMRFTGECYEAALSGIPNSRDHGLDSCNPGQEKLRALLALALFNTGYDAGQPGYWAIHNLTVYTITPSPRHNRLVLIADTPRNVVGYLIRRAAGRVRLPGLRLVEQRGQETFITRHLPTGAELIVTGEPAGFSGRAIRKVNPRRYANLSEPISDEENAELLRIPEMSDDARKLLSGLMVRISLIDAQDRAWAVGNWYWDPLERPGEDEKIREEVTNGINRRLYGQGGMWNLAWNGFPYHSDVALALTDPNIGIREARLAEHDGDYEISLGEAALRITGWDSSAS
ncbi:hypothetical protein ACWD6P_32605 [Streptomyces sp. NPDC002446]